MSKIRAIMAAAAMASASTFFTAGKSKNNGTSPSTFGQSYKSRRSRYGKKW